MVAGGSIHVYGSLRGRVIAGSERQCLGHAFSAESSKREILVIDGLYKTAEDIEAGLRGGPLQARLERDAMIVEALT